MEKNKLIKARYELEVQQKQLDIDTKQTRLNRYDENKKKFSDLVHKSPEHFEKAAAFAFKHTK